MLSTVLLAALSLLSAAFALNPSCAPGGNFPSLTKFTLQLPTPAPGNPNTPDTKDPTALAGCGGYQDTQHQYFFTEKGDGAMVMKVPGAPPTCVTTGHSEHCRTELHENADWDPNASSNSMTVSLAVQAASDQSTVIGQVFMTAEAAPALKPVCEIYYAPNGNITVGVETTRAGHDQAPAVPVGLVPIGTQFTYKISYEKNVLSVGVNGAQPKMLNTYELDAPQSYFKVGNYDQGTTASDVHFYSIDLQHS